MSSLPARGPAYRVRRMLERVRAGGSRALILLYHRIADEVSDPFGLCVAPADFEQHLRLIRDSGRPIEISALHAKLRQGSLPDRAICITFDDGYLDNLEQAAPLLEQYDIPATIFVTTGAGGRAREFWWDELERIFLQPGTLPEQLEIDIAGRVHSWSLSPAVRYTIDDQLRCRGWHMDDEQVPSRRHEVFRDVYHRVRPLAVAARTAVMDRLLGWAGLRSGDVRRTHSVMNPQQVAGLAAGGLIRIGAHTVNHPDLSAQEHEAQRSEIESSRRELREWLGADVPGFSYPYGLYDDAAVDAVRRVGYDFACAGDHQLVNRRSQSLLLPRIDVPPGPDSVSTLLRRWYW